MKLENVLQLGLQLRLENGKRGFDAPVKVSWHPICRCEPKRWTATVVKIENSGVLQIPIDDRDHAYVLRHALEPGPKTAHPTHNQIDLHSRLAGEVELLDHWPVDEAVHFRNDSRWLSRPRLLDLVPNEA